MRAKLSTGLAAIGLCLVLAGCAAGASESFSVQPHKHRPTREQLVAQAMLQEAKARKFQAPPKGYHFTIAKLKHTHLYEWGAWYRGALHTHDTDPTLIKTITGPFDPPF